MFLNQTVPPPFLKGQSVIFFCENINRDDLELMQEADLRIVAEAGSEQINLLAEAKIDVVLNSEDSFDDEGILHCENDRPLFIKVNKIIVALLKFDGTSEENFSEKIADAQRKADVVLAAVYRESFGKQLIDCGADAVFVESSHGVATYNNRPIICGGKFFIVMSKHGVEQIFSVGSDIFETKFNPPPRADKTLEPIELSVPKHDGKKFSLPVSAANTLGGDFDIEIFKREFKAERGVIFFMLRSVKPKLAGIEMSAFRRAKLFREHLDVEVALITNEYQHDWLERFYDCKIDSRVLNMYDFFQEINREVEKPRRVLIEPMHEGWTIERINEDLRICQQDGLLVMYCVFSPKTKRLSFINFFNDKHKKIRRDCYDILGFLSSRQILNPDTEREEEIFYYRPDGSVAVHELYKFIDGKNSVTLMELLDGEGNVTKTFTDRDDAIVYWLEQLINDKDKNYFLIGDRTPEYHKFYTYLKAANFDNVKVIHQLHSLQVNGNDPFASPTKSRYKYLIDKELKADAIIALTEQQQKDILARYNLSNVFAIPHPLQKFNVTETDFNLFNVVMVGRISSEKGHDQAIDAFKIVAKKIPQAKLFFYGTGLLQAELQKKIDLLNLSHAIIFKGFTDNVAEIFSNAGCSICASNSEGFSLAVQESLQNNCPVVSFDCHYGPCDMIEDGVNGYLVTVGNVEALADRIIKIMTEPGLREKLSANCAKSVEKFSQEIVASKWAELFCRLMKNTKGV